MIWPSVALMVALLHTEAPSVATLGANPSSPSPQLAELLVDTSKLGAAGSVVRKLVEGRARTLLQSSASSADHQVHNHRVRVTIEDISGSEPGFRYHLRVESNDGPFESGGWEVECRLCTETELVASVESELRKVISLLGAIVDPVPSPAKSKAGAPWEASIATVGHTRDNETERLSATLTARAAPAVDTRASTRLLHAGIAVFSLGVAATAVGTGLALAPPIPIPEDPRHARDTTAAGVATATAGGAVLIAGIVSIAVSLMRFRTRGFSGSRVR